MHRLLPVLLTSALLSTGCSTTTVPKPLAFAPVAVPSSLPTPEINARDRDCLARAMYFESNRSSEDGMLAVGTVVMNRVDSGKFAKDVCGVVSQHRQFAPGVMTKAMRKGSDLAEKMAEMVLTGKRHEKVGDAQFFHQAGLKFPYRNMHYTAVAGGNAFYAKR